MTPSHTRLTGDAPCQSCQPWLSSSPRDPSHQGRTTATQSIKLVTEKATRKPTRLLGSILSGYMAYMAYNGKQVPDGLSFLVSFCELNEEF